MCVWEVCVCVFCFFAWPRGANESDIFIQKPPRYHSKRPGAPFYAYKIVAPRGAFNCIITV